MSTIATIVTVVTRATSSRHRPAVFIREPGLVRLSSGLPGTVAARQQAYALMQLVSPHPHPVLADPTKSASSARWFPSHGVFAGRGSGSGPELEDSHEGRRRPPK